MKEVKSMAEVLLTLTDDNFAAEVAESEKPVLVDFGAPRCAPCRFMDPIIKEFADDHADKITVGKLNIDENETTASSHGILSIPTLILFVDGKEAKKLVGACAKRKLEDELSEWI